MNLHEYQGKEILAKHGVKIQRGYVVDTVEDAVVAYEKLRTETGVKYVIVKAQIHAGGRGKGGGVKLGKNLEELKKTKNIAKDATFQFHLRLTFANKKSMVRRIARRTK